MSETDQIDLPRTAWIPWACVESNIAPDAAAAVVRQEVCRRLEREEWVPSTEGQFAIDTLLTRDGEPRPTVVEGSGEFIIAAEKKFATEVDTFALAYFSYPPETRAVKLNALAQRARPFPTVLHRLRELQRGVKVVVPRTGNDRAMLDLAEHVAQLFVLKPEERARRRRQPDDRLLQTLPQWRNAAKTLWSKHPTVAALEPMLMRSLTTKQVRETREYRSRTEPRRRSSSSGGIFNVVGELLGMALSHRWAVAIVCLVGVRGCAALSKPSLYNSSRSSGSYYSEPPSSYYNGGQTGSNRYTPPSPYDHTHPSPFNNTPPSPFNRPNAGVPYTPPSPYVPGRSSGVPGNSGVPSPGGGGRMR